MYDVIIIGTGPAGYTAGIYCARYKLNTLIIGKEKGGAIVGAHAIENWPGTKGISGLDLMDKFEEHTKSMGVEIVDDKVVSLSKKGRRFVVKTNAKEFEAKTLIFCTGTSRRMLNVAGEEKFTGKGVSYCYTCDSAFFQGKNVVVTGGGNSALSACELLSNYANKIYLIVRGNIRAEPARVERVKKLGKTEFVTGEVGEIFGDKFVKGVKLKDGKTLNIDGIFVEIGAAPSTVLCNELKIKLDENGYIKVNKEQKTNINNVFAAGDCCSNILKQVVTSSAEGAIAALGAYNYLKGGR